MTRARIPVREDQWQRTVIETARAMSWRVVHFRGVKVQTNDGTRHMTPVAADAKGWPDLVLVRERVVFAELKSDVGTVRPEQRAWLDALEAAGQEVYVWKPRDFDDVCTILVRREGDS